VGVSPPPNDMEPKPTPPLRGVEGALPPLPPAPVEMEGGGFTLPPAPAPPAPVDSRMSCWWCDLRRAPLPLPLPLLTTPTPPIAPESGGKSSLSLIAANPLPLPAADAPDGRIMLPPMPCAATVCCATTEDAFTATIELAVRLPLASSSAPLSMNCTQRAE
jgi:hypothetical protein